MTSAGPTNWLHWKSLVDPAAFRCTIDWRKEFSNAQPLELEIGCGNGLWLRSYAALHPERNVIGNELVGKFIREINRRTLRDGQRNIRLLAGDIRVILFMAFPDCSVDRVFVNFPDPWFKKRHFKRRLLNDPFLRMIGRKLRAGGDVVVVTDDKDYCAFTRESFQSVAEFVPMFSGDFLSELEGYPQTKYEKKWRAMGREIFYLRYQLARNTTIGDLDYVRAQQLEFAMQLLGIDIARVAPIAQVEASPEK